MDININDYNYDSTQIYEAYSNFSYNVNGPSNSRKVSNTDRKEYLPELTDEDIEKIIENYKKKYNEAQKKRKKRKGWINLACHSLGSLVPIGSVIDKGLEYGGLNVGGLGSIKNNAKNEEELRRNLKNLQASIKNINDSLNNPYMSEDEKRRLLTTLENFVEIEEKGSEKETPNNHRGLDNYREQLEKFKAGDIDAFKFHSDNCARLTASIERNLKRVENETNLKLMSETEQYAYAYWTGNNEYLEQLKNKKEEEDDR